MTANDEELPPLTKAEIDRMMVAIATVTPPIVANGSPLLQRLLDQKVKGPPKQEKAK